MPGNGTVTIVREGETSRGADAMFEQIAQRVLKFGNRPVEPVVRHFARALRGSIDDDFKAGGRAPFVWKPNRLNTIVAKGHGRILQRTGGLRRGIRVTYESAGKGYAIRVSSPFPGELHQQGRPGGWTIRAKPGKLLRFVVAEEHSDFIVRRRKAQQQRRAGNTRVKIPSRPGPKVVFARVVHHPGFPARKFVVLRQALIATEWRAPLRNYLFYGVVPS
jgi:phage gpG-like protein